VTTTQNNCPVGLDPGLTPRFLSKAFSVPSVVEYFARNTRTTVLENH
jgi:hypothetical protein